MVQDHYRVLGVSYDAPFREIRQAFRSLAICYHPDVTRLDKGKAEERFKKISEAYWILKDPTRRREYNRTLSVDPVENRVIYQPPSWEFREEDWIWDERQLRYRKKWKVEEGEYEARAPFSFMRRGVRLRPATFFNRLIKRFLARLRSPGSWLAGRARNLRLKSRKLFDRAFTNRLHARHSRRPHKILKARTS